MKTRASSLLVLTAVLAALAFTPGCVAPSATQAFSHPVGSVERFGHTLVARGDSMSSVERSLGVPHHRLSDQVWAYPNFNGGSEQQGNDDCTTLLLTFTEGRVNNIELINDRAEISYAARLQPKPEDRFQVAAR